MRSGTRLFGVARAESTATRQSSLRMFASGATAGIGVLFAISAWAQHCPQTALLTQYSKKGTTKAAIVAGPAEFANMPRWSPGDGPPPLAPEVAVKAALAAMANGAMGDGAFRVEDVMLSRVNCEELKEHWFYRLGFSKAGPQRDFESTQIVIVMMDGTVRGPLPMFDNGMEAVAAPPPKVEAPKITLSFDALVPMHLYEGDKAGFFTARPALQLFDAEDFAQLDSELDRLRESRALLPDGQSHFSTAIGGLVELIGATHGWETGIERIQTWRNRAPKSGNAAIVEARAWSEYAWQTRGGGFANNVSDKANELYRERLAKARRILDDTKPFAAANPMWYTSMLSVATGESWPIAKQREVFNEGVARHPRAAGIYVAMAFRMTPRWGGNIAMYREFTDLAVKQTSGFYGNAMYAWMYMQYAEVEHDQPFRDLGIPWPQMKSGFEEILAKYPATWNLNLYAYYACRANDETTFLALLPRLTKETVRPEAWRSGDSFETCREGFTKRT